MGRLIDGLKRAFAVEKAQDFEPSDAELDVVDRVCREVVRRGMTTPALMFLEMSRPLNFLSAQAMHFFQPIVSVVVDSNGYKVFASFLEHRGSIDFLCRRIEHFEHDMDAKDAKRQAESDARSSSDENSDL